MSVPCAALALLCLGVGGGCGASGGGGRGEATSEGTPHAPEAGACPAKAEAPAMLPGVNEAHRTAAYWIARTPDADRALLSEADIHRHRAGLASVTEGEPRGQMDLRVMPDRAWLAAQMAERVAFVRERAENGTYLDEDGARVTAASLGLTVAPATPEASGTVHRAEGPVALRCAPTLKGLYTKDLDLAFDRNLCSTAAKGELVEVMDKRGPVWLARTTYTMGWIDPRSPLSPPLGAAEVAAELDRAPKHRALTRRALLEEAFALLDSAYGWGGKGGGRDCSEFLLDVFAAFGVALPRNSVRQAIAGSYSIAVEGADERDKLEIIDRAHAAGAVLLHFPGHIMLYLGRDAGGEPMAIHSFAEYLEPCAGGGETLRKVGRVTVSGFGLGKGTSRRSFLERLTRVTVLAAEVGAGLEDVAEMRPSAAPRVPEACNESDTHAVFRSPARPHSRAPLQVMAVSSAPVGAAELWLVSPAGERMRPASWRLTGAPRAAWATVSAPAPGTWTALLADGDEVLACERIRVAPGPVAMPTGEAEPAETEAAGDAVEGPPAWKPRAAWRRATENLYAAWVASLFDYPMSDDTTWTNLETLLRNPARNFLMDHLGHGEDAALKLGPDCADLPYFLRAYFAWKLSLPFALRRCSRGRAGTPPACGELVTNLVPTTGTGPVERFSRFMRTVASGVHSATARTAPGDENTDVYPVPLTREALVPGTVFADPYGHLLVISRWLPQRAGASGSLVGAEAQPDGTIGRRTFWEGTFLFVPETRDVGAGFKAFRPLTFDAKLKTLTPTPNAELTKSRAFAPFSLEQYEGSKADFYAKVDRIANPRPRDPRTVLRAKVDALEEAVKRRVLSVNNGLAHMESTGWRTVPMPDGYDVFETEGPWEDFATPARDLRLLIALDAVRAFPARVASAPADFGVPEAERGGVEAKLRAELGAELNARTWSYTGTGGKAWTLTLSDVMDRAAGFEVSYNPNDCAETRWAAPEGSAEAATCTRRAPPEQRAKMARYRSWFIGRERPPR